MSVFSMLSVEFTVLMSLIPLALAFPKVTVKNHIPESVQTRIAAVYFHGGQWHATYMNLLQTKTFEIDIAEVVVCWMEDGSVQYIQTSFEDEQETAEWRVYYSLSFFKTKVKGSQQPIQKTHNFEDEIQKEKLDSFCSTHKGLNSRDMKRKFTQSME